MEKAEAAAEALRVAAEEEAARLQAATEQGAQEAASSSEMVFDFTFGGQGGSAESSAQLPAPAAGTPVSLRQAAVGTPSQSAFQREMLDMAVREQELKASRGASDTASPVQTESTKPARGSLPTPVLLRAQRNQGPSTPGEVQGEADADGDIGKFGVKLKAKPPGAMGAEQPVSGSPSGPKGLEFQGLQLKKRASDPGRKQSVPGTPDLSSERKPSLPPKPSGRLEASEPKPLGTTVSKQPAAASSTSGAQALEFQGFQLKPVSSESAPKRSPSAAPATPAPVAPAAPVTPADLMTPALASSERKPGLQPKSSSSPVGPGEPNGNGGEGLEFQGFKLKKVSPPLRGDEGGVSTGSSAKSATPQALPAAAPEPPKGLSPVAASAPAPATTPPPPPPAAASELAKTLKRNDGPPTPKSWPDPLPSTPVIASTPLLPRAEDASPPPPSEVAASPALEKKKHAPPADAADAADAAEAEDTVGEPVGEPMGVRARANWLRAKQAGPQANVRNPAVRESQDLEDLDPRAIEAAMWTDKEIRKLIAEIKSRGYVGADGKHEITFGQLFEETGNIFDALSGICKTAKKYSVVGYDAEQLWQGTNDTTVIKLLKETHDGVEIKRRKKSSLVQVPVKAATSFGSGSLSGQGAKCHVCQKTVYQMEFVGASDKAFHKTCFRCTTCMRVLQMNDYAVGADMKFYCTAHHRELFMKTA